MSEREEEKKKRTFPEIFGNVSSISFHDDGRKTNATQHSIRQLTSLYFSFSPGSILHYSRTQRWEKNRIMTFWGQKRNEKKRETPRPAPSLYIIITTYCKAPPSHTTVNKPGPRHMPMPPFVYSSANFQTIAYREISAEKKGRMKRGDSSSR